MQQVCDAHRLRLPSDLVYARELSVRPNKRLVLQQIPTLESSLRLHVLLFGFPFMYSHAEAISLVATPSHRQGKQARNSLQHQLGGTRPLGCWNVEWIAITEDTLKSILNWRLNPSSCNRVWKHIQSHVPRRLPENA